MSNAETPDDDAPTVLGQRLQRNFKPATVVTAADGGLRVAEVPPLELADEDFVCLRGPCRNYHEMETDLDAAQAMDGSMTYADGTPISRGRQTIRTCYPAPGREYDLTDVTIYRCNRWDPVDPTSAEYQARERRRAARDPADPTADVRRPGGILAWLRRALT